MDFLVRLALLVLGLAALVDAVPTINTPSHCGGVPQGKRGVSYNDAQLTRFFRTDYSKVVWMYNWDSTTADNTPNTGFEYVPMLWSNVSDSNGTSYWHYPKT